MREAVLTETARAKVNLTLRVVGRRPDGYHALESLVAFARAPVDVITFEPGRDPEVRVEGPGSGAILGENLLQVVLRKLRDAEPRLRLGDVTLDKHLPVAAGVGGGSADAAALLRAVRRANPALASAVPWMSIAKALGADVPVCMQGVSALMWGIGDRMAPVALPPLDVVIANPMLPVPADKTAQVFRRLGAAGLVADPPDPAPPHLPSAAAVVDYMRGTGNDLTAPASAVVPAVATVLAALEGQEGCLVARLSGGGPTCFGVFECQEAARLAAAGISAAEPSWWVVATALE
jgi:4-diphosphocytidyl-2-C-methyl-D-erythritol kinase